ncbi:hypothetical protein GTF85_08170 [Roseobacter sp. HKCCD7924]|nr:MULTISPECIES: hypothetical protein [unclassified Roseobacter]NNV30708.1 hypothetical protein [Roseobacter sp. HKCCD9061]NNW41196.1 hypothetical protein [Roseobacter sp. HKCCD8654]NNY46053.1 hypothetical protein [Roseobacter sp. HKCCD8801]NNY50247.1 hypothetical protein [Roseobacter sp. HKCCD8190]NNZ18139.1 hypothetical protein [Roseobacter sp. HKCCD6301]NNZ81182.1 hypothetical protein [Roseobacter sp. HKCCD7538]NOA96207.1 hypothetical protein [Roseobacter sp. HKCCD8703]NOE01488.1 hypothe
MKAALAAQVNGLISKTCSCSGWALTGYMMLDRNSGSQKRSVAKVQPVTQTRRRLICPKTDRRSCLLVD